MYVIGGPANASHVRVCELVGYGEVRVIGVTSGVVNGSHLFRTVNVP